MTKTTEDWRQAAEKAFKTGKMANTLAKALAKRYSKRWQFVDFLGPKGRESAGVVDIVAIRKCGKQPTLPGLLRLDLFDIILMQVKGGRAAKPTTEDIKRLKIVSKQYHAQNIVLFEWQDKKKVGFQELDKYGKWKETSAEEALHQGQAGTGLSLLCSI